MILCWSVAAVAGDRWGCKKLSIHQNIIILQYQSPLSVIDFLITNSQSNIPGVDIPNVPMLKRNILSCHSIAIYCDILYCCHCIVICIVSTDFCQHIIFYTTYSSFETTFFPVQYLSLATVCHSLLWCVLYFFLRSRGTELWLLCSCC